MKRWAGAVAAVLVCVGVYVVQQRRSVALAAVIKQKQRLLQQFAKENATLPAAGEIDWLSERIRERTETSDALLELIDPQPQELPSGGGEQGLYVVEQLHRVTTALRRQAETSRTVLPTYLGFSEDLPPPEQVRWRLRQVEMLERVVGAFIRLGALEVTLIKPLDPRPVTGGAMRYTELPLQLSLRCPSATCVRALHELQGLGPLVAVREIKLTRQADDVVGVELVASAVVVERAAADAG